jgi:hypothetical protein
MSEVEIPTAREVPFIIVIAEPVIVEPNRHRWKCKITFFTPMCVLFLSMLTFLMVIFWNQRRH